jgi:hypothetical protein
MFMDYCIFEGDELGEEGEFSELIEKQNANIYWR